MLNTLFVLPLEYWVACILLVAGFFWSAVNVKNGIGVPMAVVLATVSVWYMVDVIYNDYETTYMQMFPIEILAVAWWQVIIFLLVFLFFAPIFHFQINRRYLTSRSQIIKYFKTQSNDPEFQLNLTVLFRLVLSVWWGLLVVAIFRYQENVFFFLFPYLGKHPGPWLISGVGGGIQSLFALATNLHMLVGSVFGVIAALSRDKRVRRLALLGILLSWPLYFFDRTRSYILLIVIPGVLAWVFLRLRGGLLKKLVVLALVYMFINAWFGFIIATRVDGTITNAILDGKFSLMQASEEHHQGLNMFEELSWIVKITENGTFHPEIGENYFANLVNVIPRNFWPSKPTIGLDYAIARGLGDSGNDAGVAATLSEGLIGQGVVNFGVYWGSAFAALLMSLWVCLLARIDLMRGKIGYLPLFGLGLILTFNLGRDITFLSLYPFVFGYIILWWVNKRRKRKML
ncbi:hypothetical protein [Methylovulum psychrotolerans]|uniref:Oligosaccharide repeat unit polymerase n=1 Tax=Methylovulum psychrotolerans TaxID=1704499 RepID=A0A2S5CMV3_9GAMM|nr:hypothetical protein [Methylovulum psychrotolerans]POZ52106.1 hypothetical protein AADEFJLK_02328 [Methylovulum psychrotolerans]